MAYTSTDIQKIYVEYFNRPADPIGLDYWVTTANAVGNLNTIYSAFGDSLEYAATFAGFTNPQIVSALYQNLFGRAPEFDGLVFWSRALTDGSLSVAKMAAAIAAGAQGTDLVAFNNKVTAAVAFTTAIDTSDELVGYSGTAANALAKAFITSVTDAASLTAALAAVDVTVAAATAAGNVVAGQTFTLTASTTDEITGTAGADTISANHLTIQGTDIINGGAGTDTLTILNTGATLSIAPAILNDVENIQVTSSSGATSSAVNLVAATGVEKVISKNSVVADSFTNIQSLASVEIDGTAAAVTATYKNTLAGATATASVTLKGGATVSELDIAGAGGTEFGIISVVSEGTSANTLTLIEDEGSAVLAALVTLNVTGAADLTLGTASAAVAAAGTTINASTATGNLTVNGTNFETITLGTGDDTLYLGSTQVSTTTASAKVALDGGSGANTLVFGAQDLSASGMLNGAAADADTISNFQTVTFTVATPSTSAVTRAIEADAFTGITTIVVDATNASSTGSLATTVAVTGLTEGQKVQGSSAAAVGSGSTEVVTLAMASPTGTADAVTYESVAGTNAAVNVVNTLTVSQTTVDSVAQSVETLNVIASRANVSTTVGTTIGAISAGSTTTLNISGAQNITVGTVELDDSSTANTTVATINASALTGNLILGASGADFQATDADDISVTLGAGTNAVYGLAALDDGDTITGTTGTDTVHITGGSGAVNLVNIDTVQYTSGNATTTSAANWTVGTIDVTNSTLSSTISNIAAAQVIKSDDIDSGATLTLNVATGVTALAVELDTATASVGTLATNATSLSINHSGVDGSGDYANNALVLNATPTDVTLLGGGETSSTGAYSTFALTNSSSGLIDTLNSTYNGNVTVSGVYFNTVNGATVTTGATTVASTTTTKQSDLTSGIVRFVDTAGTDTLAFTSTGGDLGFINVSGYETIAITDLDMGSALAANLRDVIGATRISIVGPTGGDLVENITLSNVASGTTFAIAGAFGNGADTITLTSRTGTTDTVILTTAAAAFSSAHADAAVTLSGFETVTVAAGADDIDLGTKDATLTLTGTTSLLVGGDLVADTDDGDIVLGTVAATSATSVELNSVGGSVTVATLGTMDSLESLTLTAATGETTTLNGLSSSSLDAVTISGAGTVTISALTGTSLDAINAGSATGAVTLGSSSAALTVASGAQFTTGEGNDVVYLGVANLHAVDAGEKASDNDTMYIKGAMNSGAIVVDLSASGDQMATFNGAANAAVQTGFESVNLSAITSTGSYGATITANAAGSSITGTAYNDVIYGGDGVDTIIATGGTDTVSLGAGIDTVTFAALSVTQSITVTDFVVGTGGDILAVTTAAVATASSVDASGVLSTVNLNGTSGAAAVATGFTTIADNVSALTAAGIYAALTGGTDDLTFTGATDVIYGAIDNGTDTVIFKAVATSTSAAVIDQAEITIIGILTGATDATAITAANLVGFV